MKIKIGSYIENSLIDVLFYPSFVIFFSGCNFKCPWCQNADLVKGYGFFVEINDIIRKIEKNFIIDFVQASGGEPTLQKEGLEELFKKVKEIGLKTSISTNGYNCDVIKELLEKDLLDHIALDIKAPVNKYSKLAGIKIDFSRIENTLKVIKDFDFIEIRTTFVPNLLEKKDLIEISKYLLNILDDFYYVIQQFVPRNLLDPSLKNLDLVPEEELEKIGKEIKKFGIKVYIRSLNGIKKI